MKRLYLLPTTFIVATLLCSCFADRIDRHFHIPFKNNMNHSIYVFRSSKEQYNMFPHFQDTLLHSYYSDPSLDSISYRIKPGEENEGSLFSWSTYESSFGNAYDTLLVFIINADTLENNGWNYIRENYIIEQRYDLSLADLQNVGFKLSFPPNETMKHIHMWPPYGTYDEHGQRKDKKH